MLVSSNSDMEALSPSVAELGDGACEEVLRHNTVASSWEFPFLQTTVALAVGSARGIQSNGGQRRRILSKCLDVTSRRCRCFLP